MRLLDLSPMVAVKTAWPQLSIPQVYQILAIIEQEAWPVVYHIRTELQHMPPAPLLPSLSSDSASKVRVQLLRSPLHVILLVHHCC